MSRSITVEAETKFYKMAVLAGIYPSFSRGKKVFDWLKQMSYDISPHHMIAVSSWQRAKHRMHGGGAEINRAETLLWLQSLIFENLKLRIRLLELWNVQNTSLQDFVSFNFVIFYEFYIKMRCNPTELRIVMISWAKNISGHLKIFQSIHISW